MSSFKKRVPSAQASLPAGCRLSAYNGQVLISTGVPSLDDILGGGLPVGTILLIQEDRQTSYGQLLLKYFLRQGIVAGDKCVVVSGDESPEAIVRSLMGIAGEESLAGQVQQGVDNRDDDEDSKNRKKKGANDDEDSDQDRLTIAWRYSGLKKFESGVEGRQPGRINVVWYIHSMGQSIFGILIPSFFFILQPSPRASIERQLKAKRLQPPARSHSVSNLI